MTSRIENSAGSTPDNGGEYATTTSTGSTDVPVVVGPVPDAQGEQAAQPDPVASAGGYLAGLHCRLTEVAPAALLHVDEAAVYQLRTTSRRMSATLEVLGGILPEQRKAIRRLGRVCRKARRWAGDARDDTIMKARLGALPVTDEEKEATARLIWPPRPSADSPGPSARAEARLRKLQSGLEDGPAVIASVEAQETARLRHALAAAVRDRWLTFSTLADLLVSQLGTSVTTTFGDMGTDPHDLRLAGKAARYAMELALSGGVTLEAEVLRRMKQMQDELGSWHDHDVLASAIIARCRSEVGISRPGLAASALRVAAAALDHADADLHDFAARYEKHGRAMDGSVALAVGAESDADLLPPAS